MGPAYPCNPMWGDPFARHNEYRMAVYDYVFTWAFFQPETWKARMPIDECAEG